MRRFGDLLDALAAFEDARRVLGHEAVVEPRQLVPVSDRRPEYERRVLAAYFLAVEAAADDRPEEEMKRYPFRQQGRPVTPAVYLPGYDRYVPELDMSLPDNWDPVSVELTLVRYTTREGDTTLRVVRTPRGAYAADNRRYGLAMERAEGAPISPDDGAETVLAVLACWKGSESTNYEDYRAPNESARAWLRDSDRGAGFSARGVPK